MEAGHSVEPDQFEPGIPLQKQAHWHQQSFILSDLRLDAELGVNEWLAGTVQLPFRVIRQSVTFRDAAGGALPEFESIHHRNETLAGIGDVVLGARFSVLRTERLPGWMLHLRAGASVPTGHTEPDPFELGRRGLPHQHMFFGTGTVDPFAAIDLTVPLGSVQLTGWASGRTSLYRNRHGYRAGATAAGGIGVRSSFGLERWSFLVQPEVFHETAARWGDRPAENSGRTDLLATGAIVWAPTQDWAVNLSAKIPVYSGTDGGQLRTPVLVGAGVMHAFDVFSKSR